ncbi:PEP-utilizing enzyme [Alcanivorax sp. IL3]|uniref:PEP-utilizing enzyme n=1 Tax=unclassified Alcanivorax TaxID=2638842 RepID=UPI0039C1B6E7
MGIEVLTADAQGSENLQRWAAMGLPVPPSWRVKRDVVQDSSPESLAQQLRALPRMFSEERYWVLQQGPMNPDSQRESLLNLDSDESLAAALRSIFQRKQGPDHVVIQALPRQQAAGVLFTRHPLRQDLPHMVVEGVLDGSSERQRLIFDDDGRLVHASHEELALGDQVGAPLLRELHEQLKQNFQRPQAGEWVFDGQQLWLLQTLPVGSLPMPKEAWTRRAGNGLFTQVETPLWYTLAGRWLKTAFWEPLVAREGWQSLAKVEPYRRQHSHLYTNCAFFRELQSQHAGASRFLPPAWQQLESRADTVPGSNLVDRFTVYRHQLTLARVSRDLKRWQHPAATQEGLWRAFMQLDGMGERLSGVEGEVGYLALPDRSHSYTAPFPLEMLVTGAEKDAIDALVKGRSEALRETGLRPGADPVHAPLNESPAQAGNLNGLYASATGDLPSCAEPSVEDARWLSLARQARGLRFAIGNRLRSLLRAMGAVAVNQGRLQHPDDIYFLYFDELWQLWMAQQLPASANREVIGDRKLRYLDDGLQGAPDWKMDQIGYGFGGGQRLSPLLRGLPLVPGRVEGPIRRVCSAWSLNRICPGDIVVVDQVEPAWLPWLVQAGGLVIAEKDPCNGAASLAVSYGIPAIWSASDVMHSVQDELPGHLDATHGSLDVSAKIAED